MRGLMWFCLIVLSLLSLFPFYIMLVMGTHYTEDLFKGIPLWFGSYVADNLRTVFQSNFGRVYLNSLLVSAGGVVLALLTSSTIGYAVAKFDFRGRRALQWFVVVTMMVPTQVGLIGYIIEMRQLGFGNTLWPVILTWAAFPFGAFFMIQFMRDSVPNDLMECARIDGCSEPGILFRVVLPIVKPGLATLATLVFIWSWNNYLLPLVTINNARWYTLPVFISNLGIVHRTDYAARMAALAMTTIPVLILFLLGSRTFMKGMTAGAVKG
ncbi:sugar ABC transporter permease [Cohnella xylanilytica]|uniref:Carbohydrate ABC transporter permease n=1 Tax=Cohnella xylanilytica TaxID=557555 RepID=A0A841U4E3_9BACL|nr:carbohydrate ABC transporter permease [Cohnella xylanilytica]MBB6692910.1 carbohydrate ABC transporter permease [Cohnella xylanilytica]GIO11092.1 sugar ABC transporter permease [Cohnella xylanilytica]